MFVHIKDDASIHVEYNYFQMKDKERCMVKMKRKIKQILGFNSQFADENDYLKRQHEDMKACIEQYKNYIVTLEEHQNRLSESTTANQTCPRCSIAEASAIKTEKNNVKLNEDVVMLKNVVFRYRRVTGAGTWINSVVAALKLSY